MTSPSTQGLGAEVLAQLPIAAISQTIGGEIVAVNDEAVRILGIEAAALIGRTPEAGGWLPVHEDGTPFTPEDRPDRVAVRTGRAVRNVLMGTSDGHGPRRWFRVSSEPRLATNGAPVSVLTLLSEVTDGQRRLRELVELISLSDDMMTRHDLTGRCVWASPATRELIGSGPRYVVGSPGLPTAAADDDERLLADVESTVDAGEDDLPHRTWRATRIDGSVRWVETHGRLQRAEDGSPTGFALFHRDVTERRRAELEAIEAERRFRVGFEHAPIAMKLMSPSGRIIAANQAFATLTGHAQDDIVGRSWQEFVHPDDIEASFRIIAAIVSGQHGTSVRRRRYHRPDGSVADTIHHVTGVRDDDGQVVQVFSQIVDITETSRAEQRLRASEARLAAVLAAAPDGIVVMDEHGTIETFSQSAAEIFGLDSAEAVGVGIEMLLPTDWFDGNMGEVGRFLGSDDLGDGGRQRVTAQRADGSTFPLELSIAEAGVDGDHCFIGICRDVTDEEIALRRLSESEQRFRSLADAAPVGIFTTDADGLCTYTNPRWQEICGLTATEALGPGWSTALHPEDAAAILESWTATATDGRHFSESFRLLVEEQERWVHADASPSIVDGEAVAYVGVVDEITAERRANAAIAGAEERFRA
ncbi:MAG: PAS domain S-box protein, partial [Actinomycetota bacterium]